MLNINNDMSVEEKLKRVREYYFSMTDDEFAEHLVDAGFKLTDRPGQIDQEPESELLEIFSQEQNGTFLKSEAL